MAITKPCYLQEAAKMVRPSSRREGFFVIPNVKWEDVRGLHLLRQEFDRYIVSWHFRGFGVDLETGFLLYEPPGCGKTLSAKAVANEAGANFIHIKGELAVRTIFSRARTCSPCILFFDVLLIELDGADQRRGVYVVCATNSKILLSFVNHVIISDLVKMHTRPAVMDRAVLRLGRFGKLLYVPLPSPDECGLILKALARKKPMNEAAMAVLEEKRTAQSSSDADHPTSLTIKKTHFEQALKKISPSVSDKSSLSITNTTTTVYATTTITISTTTITIVSTTCIVSTNTVSTIDTVRHHHCHHRFAASISTTSAI
ncbi:hypothetical protein HYC85_016410 [Camellia sinensis]|uniref:ATPase AAA-type core domain-containing protein n=1 Tax=Camellia sinensis TaxID=4442 RepID=A0A7J7GZK5_CAMSI|nr:hypothetical protein HYC85_016410 [Camellia sinensis]